MHTTTSDTGADIPASARSASPLGIIVAAITAIVLLGFSMVFAWFTLPRFMVVFEDLDVELPLLTVMILQYGGLVVPIVATLIGLALVLHEYLARVVAVPFAVRVTVRAMISVVLCLFAALLAIGLFLPLAALMESLA